MPIERTRRDVDSIAAVDQTTRARPRSASGPVERAFADALKAHLSIWGREHFGVADWSDGVHPWVLRKDRAADNFFDPAWLRLIEGKRHLWANALNSSQVFAVNLFGPAHGSASIALALYRAVVGEEHDGPPEHVDVHFEYSGPDDAFPQKELGEKKHPTQIDVVLEARYPDGTRAFALIEVKLSEREFGACRGPAERDRNREAHPCENFERVRAAPARACWLLAQEPRRYWDLIASGDGALAVQADDRGGCPFRGGLYQAMRNWAFGRALSRDARAIRLALCVHPRNRSALELATPVGNRTGLREVFNAMSPAMPFAEINPEAVIESSVRHGATPVWAEYMRKRYLLA